VLVDLYLRADELFECVCKEFFLRRPAAVSRATRSSS
jgi:hypothetical protein